jgi:hypothetical protein
MMIAFLGKGAVNFKRSEDGGDYLLKFRMPQPGDSALLFQQQPYSRG